MNQPQPAQTENPLDKLKDIHLPEQIDQIQLAPGWWLLMALVIGLIIYFLLRWNKKRNALYLLKPANIELDNIAQSTPDNHAMAELSALLKRICLIYFPHQQIAALSGDKWTQFLNQQAGEEVFNQEQQTIFSRLTYQADQRIEVETWQDLIEQSRIAINTIIKNAVTKQLKQKSKKGGI